MRLSLESGPNHIGLFGGSFDPPHWGHIRAAQGAADELKLNQLAFLPAVRPPHKRDRKLTSFDLRAKLMELCLPLDRRFRLCTVEMDERLSGTTLDTVSKLRDMGFTEDRCHLIWLMGSDSLLDLENWHRPDDLLAAVEVAILPRPGYRIEDALKKYLDKVNVLHTPLIDISAQNIRAHRLALEHSVPPLVAQFIHENGLYSP
jgi:nicotinate-nucleotide adenylyltransferase